jgi:hypothetical protein
MFAVPWYQFAMNGTKRTVPEATPQTGILELHDGYHLALLRHVAAVSPSRSHVLHEFRTFVLWWRVTRKPRTSAALRVRVPTAEGLGSLAISLGA